MGIGDCRVRIRNDREHIWKFHLCLCRYFSANFTWKCKNLASSDWVCCSFNFMSFVSFYRFFLCEYVQKAADSIQPLNCNDIWRFVRSCCLLFSSSSSFRIQLSHHNHNDMPDSVYSSHFRIHNYSTSYVPQQEVSWRHDLLCRHFLSSRGRLRIRFRLERRQWSQRW